MDNIPFEEPKEEIRDKAPEENDISFNDNDSSNQQPPEDVVAYNELRSCADLVKMYGKSRLQTDVDFQRDFVWKNPMQTRFIDSLIKGIPIPSMCIALNHRTSERIVIDGKQRMLTIRRFLKQEGEPWCLSRLPDINEHISGKTTEQIKMDKPEYFDSVEELTLPVTVLRCDIGKNDHMNYIFAIFHRLNKSGEKLNNQEIRNCIYGGQLNKLLRKLDEMEEWRKLNLMRPGNKYRFVKQELILRFFAFFYEGEKYKGGMAEFLNDFMRKHQEGDEMSLQKKKDTFERTVQVFLKSFDNQKLQHIPANVLCPTMVGIARNIDVLEKKQPSDIRKCYQRLLENENFQEREGLANVKTIKNRLKASGDIFGAQS